MILIPLNEITSKEVNLTEKMNNFITWATFKDMWQFSVKDNLWHCYGWKSRTTAELYEIFKKEQKL